MTSVAVIIPTYNNLPELRLCLKALSQQSYKDFVAYVCVDGSTDGTLEYLRCQPYEFVKVLTHPDGRNHGRNAARNLALPYLHQHRWVAFLDSDSIPLPNWLEAFCAAYQSEEEVLLGNYSFTPPSVQTCGIRIQKLWRSKIHIQRAKKANFRALLLNNSFLSAEVFRHLGGFDGPYDATD
jgi:glycosyltransferase involved in cell wall biosynthesis